MAKASALPKAAPPAPKTARAPRASPRSASEPAPAPLAERAPPRSAPARGSRGLTIRFAAAGLFAVAAIFLVWRDSTRRLTLPLPVPTPSPSVVHVPVPPPRPIVLTTPPPAPVPPPAPTPTATVAALPIPLPVPSPPSDTPTETPKMSAAQENAFNVWLIGSYKKCFSAPATKPDGEPYFAKIRVSYKADGALSGTPRLVNPPSDPAWRPQADAALRAVKACDPLHVPDKYASYYKQWKTRTVYFDPAGP